MLYSRATCEQDGVNSHTPISGPGAAERHSVRKGAVRLPRAENRPARSGARHCRRPVRAYREVGRLQRPARLLLSRGDWRVLHRRQLHIKPRKPHNGERLDLEGANHVVLRGGAARGTGVVAAFLPSRRSGHHPPALPTMGECEMRWRATLRVWLLSAPTPTTAGAGTRLAARRQEQQSGLVGVERPSHRLGDVLDEPQRPLLSGK
eukprot:scaffold9208_cov98-Isochrysis_galbana.AAC.3